MSDAPSWAPICYVCSVCKHHWDDWQPINVRVRVWMAIIDTLRCPNCGAGPAAITLPDESTHT